MPAPRPSDADPGRAPGGDPRAPGLVQEVAARIAGGEGRRLELKRGLPDRGKVARTLAAFANGVGGLFVVGVTDDLVLCGAPRPTETAAALGSIARDDVEPSLAPRIWLQPLLAPDGTERIVAAVWVQRSESLPHAARQSDGQWEICERRAASTRRSTRDAVGAARDAESPLDPAETQVLAAVHERSAGAADGTDLDELCRVSGLARSRVRRALRRLESCGRSFGWGTGDARLFVD